MIMITANLHFLSYMIFDQVENYSQKILSPLPLKKSTPPFLTNPPPKIQKVQVPTFCRQVPLQKGGRTL